MAENKISWEEVGKQIYENVGGMSNVDNVVHCMTRVRMKIKDTSKVNADGLKAIPGVLGVVEDDSLQVIIGPGKVNKVAQAMVDQAGVKLGETIEAKSDIVGDVADEAASTLANVGAAVDATATGDVAGLEEATAELHGKDLAEERAKETKAAQKAKQKPSKIKAALKSISNIFVPMIPAFVGSGIIAGIAAILSNMITAGQLDGTTWQQYVDIMNILKNGMFAYLVIYTGINAAQVFGATPTLGGVIGAVVMLSGMNADAPITNIFTGQPLAAGQGGIIGVIFAVWLLSVLEKWLHKVIPDAVDIIVTPTISILVIGLMEIFLIMPLAGFISNGLVGGIEWVLNVGGAFAGFVLGTLFLPMVMFGLHQILTPIHVQMIQETGSTLLLPVLAMAGAGQVGATIAIWLKLKKDKELSGMIKGALPVGILGIGEPLIYGVVLPLGRPFITACIGGGIGGAVIGLIGGIGAIAIGPSGVALIPLIADGKWWGYVLGLLAAYAGGFLATFFFGIPKEKIEEVNNAAEAQK